MQVTIDCINLMMNVHDGEKRKFIFIFCCVRMDDVLSAFSIVVKVLSYVYKFDSVQKQKEARAAEEEEEEEKREKERIY